MANFDIQLTEESKKKIESLVKASKFDLRPTLRVIGIGYRKEVQMIFEHQQSRGNGLTWAPLSDKPPGRGYASRKALQYPGAPLLVRTGLLKGSMIQEGASGNISVISKTGAVFGSSISYGIYHDSDEARSSNLPRRNFSEPSDKRRDIWIEQITKDIQHNFEVNGIQVNGDIVNDQ